MTTDDGDFTMRPVEPSDAEAIARMAAELSEHEGGPPAMVVPDDVRRELERPDPLLFGFIVLADERPVAFALHSMMFDTETGTRGAYMSDLYVKREARRNGLARRLMAAVVRDATARGGTWLSWGALAGNLEAQAFYATLGEVEEGAQIWSLKHAVFADFAKASRDST